MPDTTYTASDIIGATLIARKQVPLKRYASETSPTVYIVQPGKVVGIVYSFVMKPEGLWWMFYDSNKVSYFAFHQPGLFDVGQLTEQGIKTVLVTEKEKAEAAAKANATIWDNLKGLLMPIAIVLGIAMVAGKYFQGKSK
jgi:hypothetical protein